MALCIGEERAALRRGVDSRYANNQKTKERSILLEVDGGGKHQVLKGNQDDTVQVGFNGPARLVQLPAVHTSPGFRNQAERQEKGLREIQYGMGHSKQSVHTGNSALAAIDTPMPQNHH